VILLPARDTLALFSVRHIAEGVKNELAQVAVADRSQAAATAELHQAALPEQFLKFGSGVEGIGREFHHDR
jgi:hypothetical protein